MIANNLHCNVSNCFYISAMTDDDSGGIFRCRYLNGKAEVLEFTPLERNTFLVWGKERKILYATMQQGNIGGVAAYRVKSNGTLSFLNRLFVDGRSACFLTISRNGHQLYSANYGSSNFSEIQLAPDGSLERLNQVVYTGNGIAPELKYAHPHCCGFTPDEKFLYVVDLGLDQIRLYSYDPEMGISPEQPRICSVIPAGSGPRHLIFDSSGRFAYLLNERGNTLQLFRYENGDFFLIQTASTLPAGCNIENAAAAIRFSEDRRFLLTSNRGHNTIAIFAIGDNGMMRLVRHVSTMGESPRDFNFLSGEKVIAVTNELSRDVCFFTYDRNFETILPLKTTLTLPRPLYLLN